MKVSDLDISSRCSAASAEMISPTITAAATFQIVISSLMLVGIEVLRRRADRLRRATVVVKP